MIGLSWFLLGAASVLVGTPFLMAVFVHELIPTLKPFGFIDILLSAGIAGSDMYLVASAYVHGQHPHGAVCMVGRYIKYSLDYYAISLCAALMERHYKGTDILPFVVLVIYTVQFIVTRKLLFASPGITFVDVVLVLTMQIAIYYCFDNSYGIIVTLVLSAIVIVYKYWSYSAPVVDVELWYDMEIPEFDRLLHGDDEEKLDVELLIDEKSKAC